MGSGRLGPKWVHPALSSVQLGPNWDLFSFGSAKPEGLEAQNLGKHNVFIGFSMVQLVDSWCSWDSVWEGLGFHFGASGNHLGNLLEDFGSKMAPRGGQERSNGPQGEGKSESNDRMVSNVPPRLPNGAPEPPKCMPQAPKMNPQYYPDQAKVVPA